MIAGQFHLESNLTDRRQSSTSVRQTTVRIWMKQRFLRGHGVFLLNSCLWLCIFPALALGRSVNQTQVPQFANDNLLQEEAFPRLALGLSSIEGPAGSICVPEKIVYLSSLFNEIVEGKYWICSQKCTNDDGDFKCVWLYQNPQVTLNFGAVQKNQQKTSSFKNGNRNKRDTLPNNNNNKDNNSSVYISGMTFEYESDKKRIEYDNRGSPKVLEGMSVKMRLFGHFEDNTSFKLSKFQTCDDPNNHEEEVQIQTMDSYSNVGIVKVTMPRFGELHEVFLCLKSPSMDHFVRQGEINGVQKPWLVIKLYQAMMPLWLHISLLTLLLILSGLFSGLNLGLMSLNKTDLKIIINTGTSDERHYASVIAPVRNHGNFLLCCLLFSNVLVNASLTILVDDLTSGLIAIIMSTLSIVIFGEIIPQAICSRHGLAVGAKTIYVTKFFMFLTFPLAFPLSKLLDKILGEEIGSVYTRERLKELLRVTKEYHGLETEEVGIISGALDMKSKTVKDIMVRLESAFMLPIDSVLDFDTMADVEYHGYSRIPVYEDRHSNIVGLLNIKQLTLLDANDKIPLKTVVEYYRNKLFFVFENTRLDYMLKHFREGANGHMAFVQRINSDGPGDPFYEAIGLLTLEDVLEELLQAEIMDESDIGKHDARLANSVRPKNSAPAAFMKNKPKARYELPAPLGLAAVQFLSTSVEPFSKEILSMPILQRLITNCAQCIKLPRHRGNYPDLFLYETGKPSEYFIMILEGRVEVTVGKEKLKYESGAFTTFGTDFLISALSAEKSGATSPVIDAKPELLTKLKKHTFVPDYTVRVNTDLLYLMLKFSAYKAALLATGIERTNADPTKAHNKNWQDEIDKILEKVSAGQDDDTTSISSRRPKISRDESFRGTNIALIENDGITRKTSFAFLYGDSIPENDDVINFNATKDSIEEEKTNEEKITEETKLLFY